MAVPDIPGLSQEVVERDLKAVKYNVYVRPLQPSAPVTVDRLRELVVAVINANANVGPGGRLRVAASGAIEQAWDHEQHDPVLEAEAFAPLVALVAASNGTYLVDGKYSFDGKATPSGPARSPNVPP
jgi:hypothetical protein